MTTRWFGARIPRSEDSRLVTGRGTYVDDVRVPGTLHAAFLRSPFAAARIKSIDVSRARTLPGVHLVLTGFDAPVLRNPCPLLIPNPQLQHPKTQVPLATEVVRHVGEPVACVVADSRYEAEDALELIEVDWEPLPAVHYLEQAAQPDAPRVHADLADNVAAHMVQQSGDFAAAAAAADHVLKLRLYMDRGTASSMETRGLIAWVDPGGALQVYDSTQAPIPIRNFMAAMLGLPQSKVRVVAPDVGGGFGPKVMMMYPEEVVVPYAALQLGRPVKWIEDRRENFGATTQERDQLHEVEVAFNRDGEIVGLKTVYLHDQGAYCPYGLQNPLITGTTLPGPYRLRNYHMEFRMLYTHKPFVTPYRGAGRPHGVYVMERCIDALARHLGADPNDVRRRNFIQPEEFPYDFGLTYQDGAPLRYDSGNYPEMLRMLLEMIEYDQFKREDQPRYRAAGRCVGIGVAPYVEGSGIGPFEGVRVTVEPSGKVMAATSVGTQGQGHYTSFAQIIADQLGVTPRDVFLTTGDTDKFNWGTGTFASRAAVVAGTAAHLAAAAVREKALEVASRILEAAPEDLELADGQVRVRGVPARAVSLGQVAARAMPLRGTLPSVDYTPGLEAIRYFAPSVGTFASGAHAAIIEIDPETGDMKVLRYCVVHDCGNVINPMIVEGQVHGGVAQGLGGVFYEKLVFDENGQCLTSTYMDYLLPTAREVPEIETDHLETPSPLNPLGMKGAGEAGVIPVAAMMAEAIDDALDHLGTEKITEMPLNPARLRAIIAAAGALPQAR